MKLAWLTDIHLNFVGRTEVDRLCSDIRDSGASAVLITGDIATPLFLIRYLDFFTNTLNMPVYFVLGNHDYYGSSIREVNDAVGRIVAENPLLTWLSSCAAYVSLDDYTCLIGHEGLADGRLGDPEGSTVELNDYRLIQELAQPTKAARLEVQHQLGDEAAAHLRQQLEVVIMVGYRHILVGLHVPPFAEACWHLGQNSSDEYLPHFGCQATGEVLRAFTEKYQMVSIDVYCGHTHSSGEAQILPNLRVHTGGAEYGNPVIAGIIEI